MKKLLAALFIVAILAVAAVIIFRQKISPSKNSQNSSKILVTSTIYPLSQLATHTGGDLITSKTIVPSGVEPHDFDPKPQDLVDVFESKVFIHSGTALEPWVEKIRADLESRGVVMVDASKGLNLIKGNDGVDPHYWLDPVLFQQSAITVRNALLAADPSRSSDYKLNSDKFIAKLIELDNAYKKKLFSCNQDTVVVSHNVLAYLANRYKFKVRSITGLSPNEEATSQSIADTVELLKTNNIRFVLAESLMPSKYADTLAKEAAVKTLLFNPLEGLTKEEVQQNADYFSVQYFNINTLATALECLKS